MIPPNSAYTPYISPFPLSGPSYYGVSSAQVPAQAMGAVSALPPVRHMESFMSPTGYPIHLYQLSNGHRVAYEQRPSDAISMRTFIDAGSIYEDPIQGPNPYYGYFGMPPGIAHLDEHCHFLTTQHFPQKNQWVQVVDHLGVNKNASTSHEVIQHELVFNKEDLPRMLALHGEMVLYPLYRTQDTEQEKSAVKREAQERGRHPGFQIYDRLWTMMFNRPGMQTLGKPSDIDRTTTQHLQQFHQRYYTPNQMLTVISGQVDNWSQVLQQLNGTFSRNPNPNNALPRPMVQLTLPAQTVKTDAFIHPELTHSILTFGFPAPAMGQYKDRMAFQFLMSILSNDPDGLLMDTLIQKERLAHDISVDYAPLKQTGLFTISLNTTPGQETGLRNRTLNLLEQLGTQPISEAQLGRIRNQMTVNFYKMLQNGEAMTSVLGNEMIMGHTDYFKHFIPYANSITPQDIQRVARQYLNPNRHVEVLGVPANHPMAPWIQYNQQQKEGGASAVTEPVGLMPQAQFSQQPQRNLSKKQTVERVQRSGGPA